MKKLACELLSICKTFLKKRVTLSAQGSPWGIWKHPRGPRGTGWISKPSRTEEDQAAMAQARAPWCAPAANLPGPRTKEPSVSPAPSQTQRVLHRGQAELVLVFLELIDAQGLLLIQPFPLNRRQSTLGAAPNDGC